MIIGLSINRHIIVILISQSTNSSPFQWIIANLNESIEHSCSNISAGMSTEFTIDNTLRNVSGTYRDYTSRCECELL